MLNARAESPTLGLPARGQGMGDEPSGALRRDSDGFHGSASHPDTQPKSGGTNMHGTAMCRCGSNALRTM